MRRQRTGEEKEAPMYLPPVSKRRRRGRQKIWQEPLDNDRKAVIISYSRVALMPLMWRGYMIDLQRYRRGHNEHDWKSCSG